MNVEAEIVDEPKPMGGPRRIATKLRRLFARACWMERGFADLQRRRYAVGVTVYRWLESNPDFRARYSRAREGLMDFYAELILKIAFDESGDILIDQDGDKSKTVANHAKVQRDRLKVDSLKWTAARLFPKRYGDKMDLLAPTETEQGSQTLAVKWQSPVRVVVYPMLRDDGKR